MGNQDYYAILGVSPSASSTEIKRAFRKQALATHPDRNPGKSGAEERFKQISEAYGVLGEPKKRAEYDQFRRMGFKRQTGAQAGDGFGYSQEEIFRDFFGSRASQDLFAEMQREFEKMGFRFDEQFINNLFFSGGARVFGGNAQGGPSRVRVFRFGTAGPRMGAGPGVPPQKPPSLAKPLLKLSATLLLQAGKKLGRYVVDKVAALTQPTEKHEIADNNATDVIYQLVINATDAVRGTVVDVRMPHLQDNKIIAVKIPPGVHPGTKLRLKNLGRPSPGDPRGRGDVYIELQFG